jgi:hypothetical protein
MMQAGLPACIWNYKAALNCYDAREVTSVDLPLLLELITKYMAP